MTDLTRQFDAALFERAILNPAKVSPVVTQTHSRHSRVLLSGIQLSSRQHLRPFPEMMALRIAA